MTHSLHRQGTPGNLRDDYVVFAMSAKGVNETGAAPNLQEFLHLALRHKPVYYGDMKTGNMQSVPADEILAQVRKTSIVHAVYTDIDTVAAVLRDVAAADLGMSVVVSGLFNQVKVACARAGVQTHTVEHSLGVWGRTEMLPPRSILELTTMCGHGMVAFNLVKSVLEDIRAGHMTPHEGALKLAKPCECGIFNPVRAERLLQAMAAEAG